MATWLLRRLAAALAIVFAVVTLSFIAIHLAPGKPFLPNDERTADPAVIAGLRARFGLDQPLPVQYVRYLGALSRGDLGLSFSQRRPVGEALADALPNTLLLAGTALGLDLVLGILMGTFQATHARRRIDSAIRAGTLALYSLPVFWLALVLLLFFGEHLHWLPVGGIRDPALSMSAPAAVRLIDRLRHLALPALTLGLVGAAGTARYQRAAMLEVLSQEYVRAARAKGLTERRVVWIHALRNALLPAITMVGLALPFLLTGAVLVETVFAWPGMGKLTADAIAARDYPVVTAAALLASVLVVAGSALADLLYLAADPRIRLPGESRDP